MLIAAAMRELAEETGLAVSEAELRPLGVHGYLRDKDLALFVWTRADMPPIGHAGLPLDVRVAWRRGRAGVRSLRGVHVGGGARQGRQEPGARARAGRASQLEQSLGGDSAPSAIAASFAQTTSSATRPRPAEVSKPQSVPASTRLGSPTARATSSMRSATTSGCSTKFVSGSTTPATITWPSSSGRSFRQRYSCAWRGLANGSTKPPTFVWRIAGRTPAEPRRSRGGPRSSPSRRAAEPGRAVCWRVRVDRCHHAFDEIDEFAERPILVRDVAFHGEIGRIDLQHEAVCNDRLRIPPAAHGRAPQDRRPQCRTTRCASPRR